MVTLQGYENYLKTSEISDLEQKCFYDIVKEMSHNGNCMDDILGALYRIISSYSKWRHLSNSGNDAKKYRALIQLAKYYIKDGNLDKGFNISYTKGWSSFVDRDLKVGHYIIDQSSVYVEYIRGYNIVKTTTFVMEDDMYIMLILFMENNKSYLSSSNNLFLTIHGPLHSYSYNFLGNSGIECGSLFEAKNQRDITHVDNLVLEYEELINKIMK